MHELSNILQTSKRRMDSKPDAPDPVGQGFYSNLPPESCGGIPAEGGSKGPELLPVRPFIDGPDGKVRLFLLMEAKGSATGGEARPKDRIALNPSLQRSAKPLFFPLDSRFATDDPSLIRPMSDMISHLGGDRDGSLQKIHFAAWIDSNWL